MKVTTSYTTLCHVSCPGVVINMPVLQAGHPVAAYLYNRSSLLVSAICVLIFFLIDPSSNLEQSALWYHRVTAGSSHLQLPPGRPMSACRKKKRKCRWDYRKMEADRQRLLHCRFCRRPAVTSCLFSKQIATSMPTSYSRPIKFCQTMTSPIHLKLEPEGNGSLLGELTQDQRLTIQCKYQPRADNSCPISVANNQQVFV